MKARSLLEALTDDQRLEVARELADLDAPSALRLLQTRGTPLSGVVPVQSAATSGSQSQATKRSAAAMHGAATATAAGTLATPLPRLLVIAKALVLHAAGRLQNPTLRERLQQVAGDLQLIVVQLRRAAPAPAAAGVVRIPIASVLRVIEKAKALVLQAAQRSLDPELQGRLRHVAAEIEALLVQLPPHADNGRSRS